MSYEKFQKYTDKELLNFLSNGLPQERVYSAWILGLRGSNKIQELEKQTINAPNFGTRANLINIVAGLKRVDILIVLAKYDQDEFVRARALQYLDNIDYSNIIELALSFYRNSRSKEILNTVYTILETRKYKVTYDELINELETIQITKNNNFLKYLYNVYTPNDLYRDYLFKLLSNDYILNNKKEIIQWLFKFINNDSLVLLLAELEEELYIEYLEFLYKDKIYLELSINTLQELPLSEKADAKLYKILKISNEDSFIHIYLERLKVYVLQNSYSCYGYRDFFGEIVENIVEGIKKYDLSNDEKNTILKILKIEYDNMNFEYDEEDRQYFLDEIDTLTEMFRK